MASYLVCNEPLRPADQRFERAIAIAHATRERPRCLCRREGVPMYVARSRHGFILKRLPRTRLTHDVGCPSHRPPPVQRTSAHTAHHKVGEPARERDPLHAASSEALGRLVGELWRASGLTRRDSGDECKCSWYAVRKQLLSTLAQEDARFGRRVWIPECFFVPRRDHIEERRKRWWWAPVQDKKTDNDRPLLIGELKRIAPAPGGYEFVIKHLPDLRFDVADDLYHFMSRRFASELAEWAIGAAQHLVLIAAFDPTGESRAVLGSLHLMTVDQSWRLGPVPRSE